MTTTDPIRKKSLANLFQRAWLSPLMHSIGGIVLAVTFMLVWDIEHRWARREYNLHTEPALASALANYNVVRSDEEMRLMLQYDGREFLVTDEPEPGSLGLGRLPGIRGVLVELAAEVHEFNQKLAHRAESWFAGWRELKRFYDTPLTRLTGTPTDALQVSPTARLRIARAPLAAIATKQFSTFEFWIRSIEAGDVIEHVAATPPEPPTPTIVPTLEPSAEDTDPARRSVAEMVKRRSAQVATEVQAHTGLMPQEIRRSLTSQEVAAVRTHLLQPFVRDLAEFSRTDQDSYNSLVNLVDIIESPAKQGMDHSKRLQRWAYVTFADAPADVDTCIDRAIESLNAKMHRRLYAVTLSESGHLWFFGAWKWWEVVYWTLAGVFAMGVFQIATLTVYGRGHGGARWDPRESFRVLARAFYAPLLSLVFFWLAISTDLVDESSVLATNTFGVLAVAFIIGLAPNHILRMLLATLQVIVRGGEKPADQKAVRSPASKEIRVPAPLTRPDVPTIADLKETIKRITLAPLE